MFIAKILNAKHLCNCFIVMYYSFKKQTLHTYLYKKTEHGKRWVTTRVPDSYNFCD